MALFSNMPNRLSFFWTTCLVVIILFSGQINQLPTAQAEGVALLEELPTGKTGTETTGNVNDLNEYLAFAFPLAVRLAATLAILMIVLSGFQYMLSVKGGGKEEAKNRIYDAVFGLLLALAAWLILNTINPDLTQFDFSLEDPAKNSSRVETTR